jgi:predicted cupin superfamily sugar epimerase
MLARDLIAQLELMPHPEGGHYRETWRTPGIIPPTALPPSFAGGPRAFATSILFLLEAGAFSALHRIASDELWFFHAGDPLDITALDTDAAPASVLRLGAPPAHTPFHVIPAGRHFGARVAPGGAFSLVSCVVAPGFDFADFAMPSRADLLATFPNHADIVRALTRGA